MPKIRHKKVGKVYNTDPCEQPEFFPGSRSVTANHLSQSYDSWQKFYDLFALGYVANNFFYF
jgi:hypothetical protein